MDRQQDQVDRNYQSFLRLLPNILDTHRGEFALMQDGAIIEFHSTLEAAKSSARIAMKGFPYSIQQVTDVPKDLGNFSHAGSLRRV